MSDDIDIGALSEALNYKADNDLGNLMDDGENIANWSSNMTNCITKIPQDIKLEINDNKTITIKAGTKCYIPNGFESDGITRKFDTYVYPTDYICQNPTSIGDFFLLPVIGTNYERHSGKNATFSGPTQPTMTVALGIWYDTANNVIKMTNDTGTTWIDNRQIALPVATERCITANTESSITQVFNGFGYIGATLFALPGLKGLIPNGRNEDGTLKNIRFQTTEVMINTETRDTAKYVVIGYNDGQWQGSGRISSFVNNNYDEVSNYNYDGSGNTQPVFRVGKCSFSNGKYTQISKKEVLHVADTNDIPSLSNCIGFPDYSAGVSKSSNTTYTAESDGYIFAQVFHNASSGSTFIQVTINGSNIFTPGATDYGRSQIYLPIKKGDVYKVVANDGIVFYPIRS